MGRFYASLVILASILGICFYSYNLFSETSGEMLERLDAIEEAALADADSEVVSGLCAEYSARWRVQEKKLLRVVRHPQLDEIGSLTAELRYLAIDDGYSHLLAAVDRIKANLEKVGNAEVSL